MSRSIATLRVQFSTIIDSSSHENAAFSLLLFRKIPGEGTPVELLRSAMCVKQ